MSPRRSSSRSAPAGRVARARSAAEYDKRRRARAMQIDTCLKRANSLQKRRRERKLMHSEAEIADLTAILAKWTVSTLPSGPKLPELSQEDRELVADAASAAPGRLLIEKFHIPITGTDIARCRPGAWLNDEVINFYMELIEDRSRRRAADAGDASSASPRVVCHNTFFYSNKLTSGGKAYNYKGVSRWLKKKKVNLARGDVDVLVFPVHVSAMHWACAAVDFRARKIRYADSLYGPQTPARFFEHTLRYVGDEWNRDRPPGVPPFDPSGWTVHATDPRSGESPMQENGNDCGVFTVITADYLAEDRPLEFAQKHMALFRSHMIRSICRGVLN